MGRRLQKLAQLRVRTTIDNFIIPAHSTHLYSPDFDGSSVNAIETGFRGSQSSIVALLM